MNDPLLVNKRPCKYQEAPWAVILIDLKHLSSLARILKNLEQPHNQVDDLATYHCSVKSMFQINLKYSSPY